VRPCKPLKVMYVRGVQMCYGGFWGKTSYRDVRYLVRTGLENGVQHTLVCASSTTTSRDNDKRVMRGEAEIDAKLSKIDDQK
jgi:hypothetical protein